MPEDMGSVIAQMSREILPDQKQPESASERAGALILRLPRELRDMIYEHIIPSEDVSYPDHGDVMLRHHNSTLLTDYLIGAQIISESLYQELSTLHIQRKRYRIFNGEAAAHLMDWLRQIHGGFEHVRRLYFHDFNPVSLPNAYTELLRRCTNLQALTLHGRPSRLIFVSFTSVYQREEDPEIEVVPLRVENLDMFRNLRKLQKLEWRTFHDRWGHDKSRGRLQALQFKLLLGSGTQVVWTQPTEYYKEISEIIEGRDAIVWAHQMLEAEDFGFVKKFKGIQDLGMLPS